MDEQRDADLVLLSRGCGRGWWRLGGTVRRYPGLVLTACLAASGCVYAATTQEQKDAAAAPRTDVAKPGATDNNSARRSNKSATTFEPTEKIRADSAVSFPVDI